MDTKPVLKFADQVLDLLAWQQSTVSCEIGAMGLVFEWMQPFMPRSAWAVRSQLVSKPRSPTIAMAGGNASIRCPLVVVHLHLAEHHARWSSFIIAGGMEIGVQTTTRASDCAGQIPYVSRRATVRRPLNGNAPT